MDGTRTQRGAALVELAIVMPLLLLLLFGIIEAGWALSQRIELQSGARDAARLVAVDFGSDAEVVTKACDEMGFSGDTASVEMTISLPGTRDVGQTAVVRVRATYHGLTHLFDGIFGNASLHADVQLRLEQEARSTLGTGVVQTCA